METASISECGRNTYQTILRHTSNNYTIDRGNLKRRRNICVLNKDRHERIFQAV
jgi:hypothetical protein